MPCHALDQHHLEDQEAGSPEAARPDRRHQKAKQVTQRRAANSYTASRPRAVPSVSIPRDGEAEQAAVIVAQKLREMPDRNMNPQAFQAWKAGLITLLRIITEGWAGPQ
jgi:hypothetical protein